MPRCIYTRLASCGYFYDERFEIGYFEDDDLIKRLGDIPVYMRPPIAVNHLDGGGLTIKKMGEQKWFDINKKIFEEKWN